MPARKLAVLLAVLCLLSPIDRATFGKEVEPKSYPVLSGVGLALALKDGQIVVSKVIPKSPAEESGSIRAGARITSIEVDGKELSLEGKRIGDAASLLRGPVGVTVTLTIIPADSAEAVKVALKRAPLEFPGVSDATYARFIAKPCPALALSSIEGKPMEKLSDFRGKVVVLDFWASWCPTCYQPVAKLQDLARANPDWKGKVELIAVTVDAELPHAAAVIQEKQWAHTSHRAADIDALEAAGINVVPVIMIIGPDGTIAMLAAAHAVDVEKEVSSLLAK